MSAGDERLSPGLERLYDLLEDAQDAAEEAGEPELAHAISHLRILHTVGWAVRAVVALGELVEQVREVLRRTDPGGGA